MRDGFVKVAACTPSIRVADLEQNQQACVTAIQEAVAQDAKVVVLPELCLTGATCGDLFHQDALVGSVEDRMSTIAAQTASDDAIICVGAPVKVSQRLYDCVVVINRARILGIVPKSELSAAERRFFAAGPQEVSHVPYAGSPSIPFGARQLFSIPDVAEFAVGVEFGDDLCANPSLSESHACAGATVLACASAQPTLVGSASYLRTMATLTSSSLSCACVVANAGEGESTTDYVFSGQCLVAERGTVLDEAKPFGSGLAITEVDVRQLAAQRRHMAVFQEPVEAYEVTNAYVTKERTKLTRTIDPFPFIPDDDSQRAERCEEILGIQSHALAGRMRSIGAKKAVVGISGGLDSTLALLVTARAFDLLGLPRKGITAITMPGFGTTDRTHNNAWQLTLSLGATPREIPIGEAVRQHFADIDHDENVHNAAYENAQARERTQILMDVANDNGGIVVGTGDLSELALGWATYNGDHMSMYAVNAAIPKTLIRYVVRHIAETCDNERESEVLLDVLDTPVSPELLPANDDGTIAQQTEDLVGPYELHDFFLFQLLRYGFSPRKIYRLAQAAFDGIYDEATILKWLKVFCRRFFSQQFKRSCSPDGPAIGTVGLSPRGGLVMPSDASSALWLAELEKL